MSDKSLNHDYTLANLRTEASYSRREKKWTWNSKQARIASKRYNKAIRKASKLQLKKITG